MARWIFHLKPLVRRWVSRLSVVLWILDSSRALALVSAQYDSRGLTSLQWNGTEFIADSTINTNVFFLNGTGTRYQGAAATEDAWDAALQRRTFTYPWGRIEMRYLLGNERFGIEVTVTNASPDPIIECVVGMMTVQLPQRPPGVPWELGFEISDLNIDDITALPADFGSGLLVLCNDRPGLPLKFGFTSPVGPLRYVVRMSTLVTDCPDDPRIAPGATQTYAFSMRFAPGGTNPEALIGDLHAALAAQLPRELNWEDRRCIGTLFLASAYHSSATNTRGWLNDPTIDTVTPAGRLDFQTRLLAHADGVVTRLRAMNAQGMILWDVEGEEYPYVTYAGDPRRVADLAPEMDAVADSLFQKFRDAGFRTGVCIRPSRIVPGFPGNGHVWDHDNYFVGEDTVTANLIAKVAYAKARWGCTLFYIDTNVDWTFDYHGQFVPRLLRAEVLRDVLRAHPDILLIPEIPRTGYWAYSAPYREVNGGFTATPARSHAVYPGGFTTVEPKDNDWNANRAAITAGVARGDVLLFRSWFEDSGNAEVLSIYRAAHPPPRASSVSDAVAEEGIPFLGIPVNVTNGPAQILVRGLPDGMRVVEGNAIVGTPRVSGQFDVSLDAKNIWGATSSLLRLRVRSVIEQWRHTYFGDETDSGPGADLADVTGDGLSNLLKFAFGLDPYLAAPADARPRFEPVVIDGVSWPAISFRRRTGLFPGATYVVEQSLDLVNWTAVTITANQVGPATGDGPGMERITVRADEPVNPVQPVFMRVRVERR